MSTTIGRIQGKVLVCVQLCALYSQNELSSLTFLFSLFSGRISDDYSTDEEYLNTIAGFESDSDDEEEKAKTLFRLADRDGSGNISMREFLEYSRTVSSNRETMDESQAAKRLDVLEKQVEENGKKLDRICEILERMNHYQQQ